MCIRRFGATWRGSNILYVVPPPCAARYCARYETNTTRAVPLAGRKGHRSFVELARGAKIRPVRLAATPTRRGEPTNY
ncbi:hypothetical protein EVAR_20188_1 [Eumeta japonica]|uniref:Uncharacterized protein n=1 Tax=Eumeta variegata TaxID=151549 RepID=A0A4C1UU84_EUMVA|nr:hypothetical protein EVAR_20188_1 [Eumeta japonica]